MSKPTPYHLGPLLGFDLETTGKNPHDARIVTVALAYQDAPGAEFNTVTMVADAGVEVPAEAAGIHGYTTDRVRAEGKPIADVVHTVTTTLAEHFKRGLPVVAFNASYDFTVLHTELGRLGYAAGLHEALSQAPAPIVDPFVVDKAADKWRKGSRQLGPVCQQYGITLEDAHTADGDATATVKLARALPERYPLLGVTGQMIHDWTVTWRRRQAEEFQDYKRRNGEPDAVIVGEWPIQVTRA